MVLALPLTPDGHGSARVGIAVVGEIDVEVGVVDENAEGKDSSAGEPSVMIFVSLPINTVVVVIRAYVPSARTAGLDGYNLCPIFQGALDVEILLVVHVLESPAIAGVLSLPLRERVRVRP